jgi:succinyl-diaminopimelate desuccinylase
MFGSNILNYWDDIISDLSELIAIPSVCSTPSSSYPFGEQAACAVDKAVSIAKKYNLSTKNIDYYACHAEIGTGEENAAVLTHLDVVPAGDGWFTDPFKLVRSDGKLIGRGVSDDKGAAVIAIHCLRALRDANISGVRKLRVIMGSGEEIGSNDMSVYFSRESLPIFGFTPDASYGICNCEKGILHYTYVSENDSDILLSFKSGTVVNAVPATAEAVLKNDDSINDIFNDIDEKKFAVIKNNDHTIRIISKGKAGHASTPQDGINAASQLIELLYSALGNRIGTLLVFAHDKIGQTTDGSKLGIDFSDKKSGSLTFNLGIVNINTSTANIKIDIRFPADDNSDKLLDNIINSASSYKIDVKDIFRQNPLYIEPEGKLISILKSSYEDITGNNCNIFSMGGGTYAKEMKGRGVAFGCSFPGENTNAHTSNEFVYEESLKKHAQICLESMYRMYTER